MEMIFPTRFRLPWLWLRLVYQHLSLQLFWHPVRFFLVGAGENYIADGGSSQTGKVHGSDRWFGNFGCRDAEGVGNLVGGD